MTAVPVSILSLGATLGEGPLWLPGEGVLWFVDIKERRLHRFDPDKGVLRSWDAPAQPGWIVQAADGGLVVGLQSGLHRFDPATGSFDMVAAPEAHLPGNRANDATVGPDGALWFGSMDDAEEAATGRFYRHADGITQDAGLASVTITNGPAFSRDGTTLYHTDTLGRRILATVHKADGTLGATRVFTTIEDGAGHPDGPTVDAEDHVWTGLFGGWAVRRYAPDGELVATVRFPVANITKIAFGGDGLTTAFATTARKGLNAAALRDQPLAGDLFAFDAGVAGLPPNSARL